MDERKDYSHTGGMPQDQMQDMDLTDFFRAMFKDAGAVGSKIASPFMRGDGTRAVNTGMQGVAAMPTPVEPPGVDRSIGGHPDDYLPNVPAKAPVTQKPIPPINKFPGTDAEQMAPQGYEPSVTMPPRAAPSFEGVQNELIGNPFKSSAKLMDTALVEALMKRIMEAQSPSTQERPARNASNWNSRDPSIR